MSLAQIATKKAQKQKDILINSTIHGEFYKKPLNYTEYNQQFLRLMTSIKQQYFIFFFCLLNKQNVKVM